MHQSDSIVIIPTYNEKENIEKIIRAVFALDKCFHILIIDDGSPDGTAAIVKVMIANEFSDRLFILERSGKLGLGTAYITGFKWALEHDYEYIFEMDADFSHDPHDLPRLYAACHDEGNDVAIGSRYVTGVNVVNWPIGRVLMSYFARQLAHRTCADELLRFKIRQNSNWFPGSRHDSRFCVLQASRAEDHRTRQDSLQGLWFPD